jgi:hypothetical protein
MSQFELLYQRSANMYPSAKTLLAFGQSIQIMLHSLLRP